MCIISCSQNEQSAQYINEKLSIQYVSITRVQLTYNPRTYILSYYYQLTPLNKKKKTCDCYCLLKPKISLEKKVTITRLFLFFARCSGCRLEF